MSQKQILLTGFDRFGYGQRPNASSEIALPAAKKAYGDLVETLILPTVRDVAAEQLIMAINEIEPAAIVMFGISAGRKVRLEQRAKNWRLNLLVPDNEGKRTVGKIDSGGPKDYSSTLPVADLYRSLKKASVPVRLSNDAGAFICNEVMYSALQQTSDPVDGTVIPTGFIHLGNGLRDQLIEEATLLVVDVVLKQNLQ